MTEVLSLDTLVEHKYVKVTLRASWLRRVLKRPRPVRFYSLRNPDELGVVEYQAILKQYETVKVLQGADIGSVAVENMALITKALDDGVKVLLIGIDDRALAQLSDLQKASVIASWSDLATEYAMSLRAVGEVPGPQTGAVSSPAFSASTAAPPSAGPTSPSA
jgi:hypothetical protein